MISREEKAAIEYLLHRLEEVAVKKATVEFVDPSRMELYKTEQEAMRLVRQLLKRVSDG